MAARWRVWLQLGEETESHFQNKFRTDLPLLLVHNNSPSTPACFTSSNGSKDSKVGSLLGETAAAAGDEEEGTYVGDMTQSDLMASTPF